jgi:hypothetical protein
VWNSCPHGSGHAATDSFAKTLKLNVGYWPKADISMRWRPFQDVTFLTKPK